MHHDLSRRRSRFLALPAILIVAVVTQAPILVTLGLSLVRWIVVRPDLGITFIGLNNYADIFSSGDFYGVVLNTALITVVSLVACTFLGILFALMLNQDFPGVNIVRTLVILPFFVMDAVAGIIWRTMLLNSSFGWNEYFASLLHVAPIDFFGVYSLFTIIILIVWQWTPFFVLIILAGFQNIPVEIMDSARVDGTGWFRELVSIRLPVIANHIEVAILLGLIFVLKVFGLIFVTTRGGPATHRQTFPTTSTRWPSLDGTSATRRPWRWSPWQLRSGPSPLLFRWFRRRIAEAVS